MATSPDIHRQLSRLHDGALVVVAEVADYLREQFGTVAKERVLLKSANQLVSDVDQTAERRLVTGLGALLSGCGFLTEEETVVNVPAAGSPWRWIIDPLDGTTNFLAGLPNFAISVALEYEGELVLGIVDVCMQREVFSGILGGSALLNGQALPQLTHCPLEEAVLATGMPFHDFSRAEAYWRTLDDVSRRSRGVRRWGAAAVDLAYVAAGRFDGFFEYAMQPWDVSAGGLLIELAGGQVSDFRGGDEWRTGRDLIAGAPGTYAALRDAVAQGGLVG